MAGRQEYTKLGFVIIEQHKIREALDGVGMLWEPYALRGRWLETESSGNAKLKTMACPGS